MGYSSFTPLSEQHAQPDIVGAGLQLDDFRRKQEIIRERLKKAQSGTGNNEQGSGVSNMNSQTIQYTFGLSEVEKASIEADINAKLPLGSPAITKLFTALGFSDVTSRENNEKLTLGVNEYEVVKMKAQNGPHKDKEVSVIRMPNHTLGGENTDMVNKAIVALRSLYPNKTLNFTLEALNASADTHGIYPGYRDGGSGKLVDIGDAVYSWIGGDGDLVSAPDAWRSHNGDSDTDVGNRQVALCLVASFG